MNAIASMAATLSTTNASNCQAFESTSKCSQIRDHLQVNGPSTAADLGAAIGTLATRASALMSTDIRLGRIEVDRRTYPPRYRLATRVPPSPGLQRAIERLQVLGYTVTAP